MSSTAFMLFQADSIQDFEDSFLIASAAFATDLNFLIFAIWKIEKMRIVMHSLEQIIIEKSQSDPVASFKYAKMNETIERVTKLYELFLVKVSVLAVFLPPLISTIINYFVYHREDESYVLPFPILLPFSWKTPVGYLIALFVDTMSSYSMGCSAVATQGFIVGSFWLLKAFVTDITNHLHEINLSLRRRNYKNVKKRLGTILLDLYEKKHLIGMVNDIYDFIIAEGFVWTFLTIWYSVIVLYFQQATKNTTDIIDFDTVKVLIMVFWSFVPLAVYTFSGEAVSNQFEFFYRELCQAKWYFFPIELQQILLTVLPNLQQPTAIRGLGIGTCTRAAFKKTINIGFSYFMTLHRIGQWGYSTRTS